MAMTTVDMESMMAAATERLRTGWRPSPKGTYLLTLVATDQPPLTTGAVDMYLRFYAWVWNREPPPAEVERVNNRLREDSYTAWARMDFSIRDAVLTTCALWAEILEQPEQEQEAIRSFLQEAIAPGSYPELDGEPEHEAAAAGDLEEHRRRDAARHDTIIGVLKTWPGPPR